MSESAGFELDRSTAQAWRTFQARLADHLAAMERDDVLLLQAENADAEEADGSAPYVQFCAWGVDRVQCEVSSNAYLAPQHVLDDAGIEMLGSLGWAPPTCGPEQCDRHGTANFSVDLERVHADRLAVMSVRALREVFGVLHPMFLSADNMDYIDNLDTEGVPAGSVPVEAVDDEPIAVHADDHEHLEQLVEDALAPMFGRPLCRDDDGDIPLVSGSAMVFVRVEQRVPIVHLFAELVSEVEDLPRAIFEVSVLNRDYRMLKFVLFDDTVQAHFYLPSHPFAPEQLRMMVSLMCETVDRLDDDLVARVGGRRALEESQGVARSEEDPEDHDAGSDDGDSSAEVDEDDTDDPGEHLAMHTLLQLDAESPGSIDVELAASVCGMDRDLILALITWNGEQEIAWRQARDEAVAISDLGDEALGDLTWDDEADVCEQEMLHARQMTSLLRRALRFVVERELGRGPELRTR